MSVVSGTSANHTLWSGAVNPISAKAMATSTEPAAIRGPGPNRSAYFPACEESSVRTMPSGESAIATIAGDSPHPAIIVIGR